MYCRTCQECGHIQESKPLDRMKTESSAKCRNCKSDALDFGHSGFTRNSEGKIVRQNSNQDQPGDFE